MLHGRSLSALVSLDHRRGQPRQTGRAAPPTAPSLSLAALLLTLGGCAAGHFGAGPMIGYSPARGATWGWEAGAGVLGAVRANVGGSYAFGKPSLRAAREPARIVPRGEAEEALPPEAVHYIALEPLGLTLGADWASNGRAGFLYGLWAGWFVDPTPYGAFNDSPTGTSINRFGPDFDCPDYDPEPTPLISGAVGVRYLGGEWEMYFTPKLVAFYCLEYAN
jgi:hypothetical protein